MKHFHLELRADFVLPVHIESVRILVPFILLHAAFYWLQMPELWGGGGLRDFVSFLEAVPTLCSSDPVPVMKERSPYSLIHFFLQN